MRRLARASAAALAIVVLSTTASVGAAPPRHEEARTPKMAPDLGLRLRALRQLEEFHAPREIVEALTDPDATRVQEGRSVSAVPMGDMTGDGVPEAVEFDLRYAFTIDTGQGVNSISQDEFTTIIRVRNARTGKVHWKKRFDDFVVAGDANVGEKGIPGLITVGGILSFYSGSSGDRYLDFEALRGDNGKKLWTKTYASVAATYDFTTSVVVDSPVSFAFVQARKGAPTEILLGLSTMTQGLWTLTAATRTVLLSGVDGTDVLHPSVDVGIDWIPMPDAVADLDGDGLHDYVVINDKGFSAGEGQEPPALGGTISARRGFDGAAIWTEGGLEFRYFAFTIQLDDVVGDGTRDFGIFTFNLGNAGELLPTIPFLPGIGLQREVEVVMLVNAGAGDHLWTKRGWWMHSPGDLDRRGKPDVVVERGFFNFNKNLIRYERLAYPGVGKLLWKQRLVLRGESCPADTCAGLLGGGGMGAGSAGDVQPDSVADRFVIMSIFQANTEERASYVLDGSSKRILIRTDDDLFPLSVAVDGKGADMMIADVEGDATRFQVRKGNNAAPLWTLGFSKSEQLLPRRSWAYGEGFRLPGDRCGDVIVAIQGEDESFYAVVDGSSAKILWSRWTGEKTERPRPTERRDLNDCR